MKRTMINIDEEKCTGCGECIPNCHEGALQIIDGKARLISDLMCDGLGACIGHCPEDAITLEEREAEAYDEIKVIEQMANKGINTIKAHLLHLKNHKEFQYMKQGVKWLRANSNSVNFDVEKLVEEINNYNQQASVKPTFNASNLQVAANSAHACPGTKHVALSNSTPTQPTQTNNTEQISELQHWPVQMHLINPNAEYFQNADFLLAADCSAYSIPNFHSQFLKNKVVGIACPKFDQGKESYIEKLKILVEQSKINTITVLRMEVPCCGSLLQLAQLALAQSSRIIPIKEIVVSVKGETLSERWIMPNNN